MAVALRNLTVIVMQTTDISWCDYSWNPVTGCSHAGPECWNCWAETLMQRQAKREDAPAYMSTKEWTQANAEDLVTTHEDRLDEPYAYGYPDGPGRIFVVSMGDLFHPQVPRAFVDRVVDRARQLPEHVWIFLTKRPDRAAELRLNWPENAWVGTSVGSGPEGKYPNTTHRIEQLRDIDAETLWVSAEPLIEPLGEVALDHVDWMVVGGESHPDAEVRREMEHEWARDLLRQCREQDVAFHFKQDSGPVAETSTCLTVLNEEWGVYEQRRIREFPELPDSVRQARTEVSA